MLPMLPFLFVLLLLTGCTPKPVPEVVDFEKDVKPIFVTKCMGCHSAGFQPHGTSTNWTDYQVAKNSIDKIKDRVIVKRNMPQGNVLSNYEYDIIKKWIDQEKQ